MILNSAAPRGLSVGFHGNPTPYGVFSWPRRISEEDEPALADPPLSSNESPRTFDSVQIQHGANPAALAESRYLSIRQGRIFIGPARPGVDDYELPCSAW
jgi:hypothetical protein